MTKLIYTAITSLDGYIEDSTGKFDTRFATLRAQVKPAVSQSATSIVTT